MTRKKGGQAPRERTAGGSSTRRALLTALMAPPIVMGLSSLSGRVLAATPRAIALPEGRCSLARTLIRSLSDGNEIRVTRQWILRFVAESGSQLASILIEGQQSRVEVEAPTSLASLAEIEERRSTAGMWPIQLTPSGLIMGAGGGMEAADLDKALQIARDVIANRYGEQSANAMVRSFAAELQRAGASLLDRLPDDLFFPSIGPINLSRQVDLPDGQTGELVVFYEALAVPGKGWLASAERQVVTRLAGTERTAREYWSLTEL